MSGLAVQWLGIKLIGLTAANGRKALVTIVFLAVLWTVTILLRRLLRSSVGHDRRALFWIRQSISIAAAIITALGLVSIWFNDTKNLATVAGLFTAGLAFALQRVITALAGYLVILRGRTFHVGDRIKMGGVRGDVISVGFLQTIIMEMGQPPDTQDQEPPGMWVEARQYSGRIVSITNAKIFDEPVYNYTRDFPYIWEEIRLPVNYKDDRRRAEQILLEAAQHHAEGNDSLPAEALREMKRRYFMKNADITPHVYWRITDNWLELAVRFVVEDHGVRDVKSEMSREILTRLDESGIGVASATYDIVGLPPVRIEERTPPPWPPPEPEPAARGSAAVPQT